MTHLEQLVSEFYDWRGFLVKRNIKVGKRPMGGHDMELDIIAYHPGLQQLIHIEASLDTHSWAKREGRYLKKFEMGEKYILSEVFPWLPSDTLIERVAIFPSVSGRETLAGARLLSIDEFMQEIKKEIAAGSIMSKGAIPEQFPLLRTIQLALVGYHRLL